MIEQDLLVLARPADAAAADFDPAPGGQHDVDQANLRKLIEHTAWFITEASTLAKL
jgi:hypothetical protein